jgi:glycosyltransferase involved in cell wall biosynthesis
MRVALVHDYFVQDGGAERVLVALHRLFPEAPVFTLLADKKQFPPDFSPKQLITSKLQGLLPTSSWYPLLTPFMPMATEHLDLSGFDLAFISSSSFAKGIIVPPSTRTICYLHTPTRFLWEARHTYAKDRGWPWLSHLALKTSFHKLRTWDYMAAQRPDLLLTNGRLSQARIQRYYQRSSQIVAPPVDLAQIACTRTEPGRFWLTGGRLVSYKRFDLCIQAANVLRAPLTIYGTGPDLPRLQKLAGKTVTFAGRISEAQKFELYRDAIAFLHPHAEDFGMTMLEVQSSGTPVIAYAQGGALEIVRPGVTGILMQTSTTSALVEAMRRFDPNQFVPSAVRAEMQPFDTSEFTKRIRSYVEAGIWMNFVIRKSPKWLDFCGAFLRGI